MYRNPQAVKHDPNFQKVSYALQKGLIGEVTPSLRSVAFQLSKSGVHCRAYFDGEPSDEERESMSCVEAQIYADLPDDFTVTFEILRWDWPEPLPQDWFSAFRRKE